MEVIAYNSGLLGLVNGSIAFASDDVYAVLLDDSYTPSLAHTAYSNVSGAEVGDADYDPVALSGKSVALNGSTVEFDSDDISYGTEVTIAAQFIVFIKGTAASPQAADPLIWYANFGEMMASTDAQFIVRTTNGIYEIAPAV
jgi:hypothetical protein